MKDGPDIARIASLIGDPARANILNALLSGKALTARELSDEAGVSPQTASSHLKQLVEGGLLILRQQGRHRYFALANEDVAYALESLMGLARDIGHTRTRTGPKNAELRNARICYNHLAGQMGIQLYDSLVERNFLNLGNNDLQLSDEGAAFVKGFGSDLDPLRAKKSSLCRSFLDWSERRHHLAGSVGRAFFSHMEGLGWAKRMPDSRIVRFTNDGKLQFDRTFPIKC